METVPRDSFPRQPLRPSYEESSGPANVQPHLPQLELALKHPSECSNLPSFSSKPKTNPLMGNCKRLTRLMRTTPPRHNHLVLGRILFSLVVTLLYIVKTHLVETTTPTQWCLRATVLFRTTTTFGNPQLVGSTRQ